MVAKYKNEPPELGYATLEFNLLGDGKKGYVYNGAWYFDVIEFNPPYMKITVLHPRKSFDVEYFHVVET